MSSDECKVDVFVAHTMRLIQQYCARSSCIMCPTLQCCAQSQKQVAKVELNLQPLRTTVTEMDTLHLLVASNNAEKVARNVAMVVGAVAYLACVGSALLSNHNKTVWSH